MIVDLHWSKIRTVESESAYFFGTFSIFLFQRELSGVKDVTWLGILWISPKNCRCMIYGKDFTQNLFHHLLRSFFVGVCLSSTTIFHVFGAFPTARWPGARNEHKDLLDPSVPCLQQRWKEIVQLPKVSTVNQWGRVISSTNWLRFLDWNLKAHSLDKDTFSRNNHGFSGKCIAVRSIHSNFSHWWKKWMELLYFTLWAFESFPFSCLLLDRCI